MKKRMMTLAVGALWLVSACTYEGAQEYARKECYKLSDPDRAYCLEGAQDDYHTYKRKREALINRQRSK